ncbi:MAG: hypothetical protein AB7R77_11935 [Ilumatobacteraceae bacterium]
MRYVSVADAGPCISIATTDTSPSATTPARRFPDAIASNATLMAS